MSRHYSTQSFLRHIPKDLLAIYFSQQGILSQLDLTKLKKTQSKPIYEALQTLEEKDLLKVEKDFQRIFELAHEGGIKTLVEEGQFQEIALVDALEELEGFYAKAFWCFLRYPELFETALLLASRDNLPARYWRKIKSLPKITLKLDEENKERLSQAISHYFRSEEGRGRSCKIDYYARGDQHYFFAFPEDYSRTFVEWKTGSLERNSYRPAFEIIFFYSERDGTLATYFEGSKKVVEKLQTFFIEEILQLKNFRSPKKDKVYDLSPLKHRSFHFQYDPDSGIKSVRLKSLQLTLEGPGWRRVTLEADSSDDPEALYHWVDQWFDSSQNAPKRPLLRLLQVTRANFSATLKANNRKGETTKSFYIAAPNICSLKAEGIDLVLRQMLIDSGLDLSDVTELSQAG